MSTAAMPRPTLWGGEIATIEKKPELLQMEGISAETINNHWKLYEAYVGKWKAIEEQLKGTDLASANQIYSDWRALKTDWTFAVGGVKNHQLYFSNLGGDGSAPTGKLGQYIDAEWGSYDAWKADLKATGMAGRGWAWLAYDWETGRLANYLGDAQNTYPVWSATPLVALDVYEHAYWADFGTDRAGYIDAFLANLDWGWIEQHAEATGILNGAWYDQR